VVAAGTLGNAGLASAGSDVDDRIAALEAQIAELQAIVASQQQSNVVQEETIAANTAAITTNAADIEEARPMAKGTKFTYGGFIQLDAIATDYSDGKPGNRLIDDFLVASLIPVEPAEGKSDSYSSFNMHAKTSRFFFKTATETDVGKVSSHIELDFILSGQGDERISNSWSSRVRHAFLKWDYSENSSIMAGQSWSTFFNVGALPDNLDFVGPVGTIFVRQPQIRWTMGGLQLAVENAATRLNGVDWDNDHEGIPDLIARYNGNWGDFGWSIAGMTRELSYETRFAVPEDASNLAGKGDDDTEFGYALSLAGKWMLGNDDLRFMFNYGDALGRYMGLNAFNDGYVDESGDIETFDQWGGFVAYRHFWSPRWNSTFSYSMAEADVPGVGDYADAGSLAESYQTAHVSLNYLPTPKLRFGGELIWGEKELKDGRDGDMSRFQFAAKYAF
jgi:hypothetical protein